MYDNFEKDLDDAIEKWPDQVGQYEWDKALPHINGLNMRNRIINKLIKDDYLMQMPGNTGVAYYYLTPDGFEVKRNITENGYVAQKRKAKEKEERENATFHMTKENLLWSRRTTIILLASLLVTILSIILKVINII